MSKRIFLGIVMIWLVSCNKATCPDPLVLPQVHLTESLDRINCGCKIITANVDGLKEYEINWKDEHGQVIPDSNKSIRICPSVPTGYNVVIKDRDSVLGASSVQGPPTACDKKEVTICTKVIIESINDLIQLYHYGPLTVLSHSAKYDGQCAAKDTDYGSAKLNAVYGDPLPGFFYKIVPMPLSCSFVGTSALQDSIKAPAPSDFVNGMPDYLNPGERVFANHLIFAAWSDYLIAMFWTKTGSSFRYLGLCPPKKELIISDPGSQAANENFCFYFYTPKIGCSYQQAYDSLDCQEFVPYRTMKRIFNPRIDGTFCNGIDSRYDFRSSNVKVTIERTDGTYIDAYILTNYYDGTPFFKYKEDDPKDGCP